jgi:hypothetical protein
VEKQKTEFTPASELKQVESLLDTLESKLHDFQQIIPRRDSRRGLIDFGGTVLKSLFGVSTISDIHLLHDTLNELQSRNSDIVHSLSSQVTYVKNLDTVTKVNANAIANLSTTVKDIMVKSYDRIWNISRDIIWLNYTISGQSELYTAVRQLEFALLRMIQQVSDLLSAVQTVLHGKLPMNFVNPTTLQNLLRNVSLSLPQGYELIAGTRADTLHHYYELARTTLIGNAHGIKILVNVPLKTASQQFTLYKIIALPSRVSSNNFAKYVIDHTYFGLDHSQRDYILVSEAYLNRCTANSITLCPADIAIYNTHAKTCESSLFFQADTSIKLCRREIFFNYRTPTLQRHGTHWFYHLPEQRTLTIRCPQPTGWTSRTELLVNAGQILNATRCSITTHEFRTLPELHGETQATTYTDQLYVPDRLSIVAEHELPLIQVVAPEEAARLDEINSNVMMTSQTINTGTLFHIQQASMRQEHRTYWHIVISITIYIATILVILCTSLRTQLCNLVARCFSKPSSPEPGTVERDPTPLPPEPKQRAYSPQAENSRNNVAFTSYSVQTTN